MSYWYSKTACKQCHHRLHAFTISVVHARILFIIPAMFGTDIIQPTFIISRTAVFIRNGSRSPHFVEFTAFRSVAKAFKSELLRNTPVVFNRHIRHTRPLALKAFGFPRSAVKHSAAPTGIYRQFRYFTDPRGFCVFIGSRYFRQLFQSAGTVIIRILKFGIHLRPCGSADFVTDVKPEFLLLFLGYRNCKVAFIAFRFASEEKIVSGHAVSPVIQAVSPYIRARLNRKNDSAEFDFILFVPVCHLAFKFLSRKIFISACKIYSVS